MRPARSARRGGRAARGSASIALVAARRPAALEQHDEARRPRVEIAHELARAARAIVGRLVVVEEVEVVQEARGLARAQPQQRVDAAVGGVEHLHEVAGRHAQAEVAGELAHDALLVPDASPPRRLRALDAEQDGGGGERQGERRRRGRAAARRASVSSSAEGEDGGEGGERVEVILPALALPDVVDEPVGEAERRHRVAGTEAPRPRAALARDSATASASGIHTCHRYTVQCAGRPRAE